MNFFPPYPQKEKTPQKEDRPSVSTLQAPPTPEDRLRNALAILDKLKCEYYINYKGTIYTRKNSSNESH